MNNCQFDRSPGWGSSFSDEDIARTRKQGGLLSVELELSRICNLRCVYCYADSGTKLQDELSLEEIINAADQAVELGARKIIVLGGGEPLAYPHIEDVLLHLSELGVEIELFTNATLLTRELASLMASLRVRPVIKMNSMRADVQDCLAGQAGTHAAIAKGLSLLLDEGYPFPDLPLGAQTIICRHNLEELPEMWIWLRDRNIIPYFEMITLQGRAAEQHDLQVSPSQLRDLFNTLSQIDRDKYGHIWEPHPSVAAFSCDRHEYSCTVTATGDVHPCPGVNISVGNIRQTPLAEILATSTVISDLRNIRTTITGPCATCDLAKTCYGCRGMAYQATGDYLASDPLCWRTMAPGERR